VGKEEEKSKEMMSMLARQPLSQSQATSEHGAVEKTNKGSIDKSRYTTSSPKRGGRYGGANEKLGRRKISTGKK
jgi:hypothetical protein